GIATALDMANLTGTSALNAVSSEFTSALDTAVIGIRSGRLTPDEAIREAIDRIARTDTMVSYESGDMSLYGAVRRSVLTGAHQMTGRMQEARLREIGAEHVEISAHAGARPEHAEWQGQVVRFDDLAEVTGYGSGEGLLGWNCSHDFMPYFPEIMEPTDNSYLDSRDAEEDYALSQRQRECERNIRQYAARAEIYRAGGITGEAKRNEELAGRWRNEARDTARLREGHVRPSREAIYP
ncbi:MAG: phage minor capsid protein, partial [Coriobacteriia bacterium]|nr:phage minor capsid protein [Coriobacteriia bacterium]